MRTPFPWRWCLASLFLIATQTMTHAAPAGGSQNASTCSAAAAQAMQRRTQLAAYYDLKLALVGGRVLEWTRAGGMRSVLRGALQVAVGQTRAFAIDREHRLLSWLAGSQKVELWLDDSVWVAAGDSGVFVIRCDGSLWFRSGIDSAWQRSADAAIHAWVGDGADYFVGPDGGLHVRGKAHRGQYGDGQLMERPGWSRVANEALAVVAHTGHALFLRQDGKVLGTGGNRFGPLSHHGIGDKADSWGAVFSDATAIATGSRHSLALRADGSLWIWGGQEGLKPRKALESITAMAGGSDDSIALGSDGSVWHWRLGEEPKRLSLPPE